MYHPSVARTPIVYYGTPVTVLRPQRAEQYAPDWSPAATGGGFRRSSNSLELSMVNVTVCADPPAPRQETAFSKIKAKIKKNCARLPPVWPKKDVVNVKAKKRDIMKAIGRAVREACATSSEDEPDKKPKNIKKKDARQHLETTKCHTNLT